MPLETTHGAFNGPYTAYVRWIKWLASQFDIYLSTMEGFSNDNCVPGRRRWEVVDDDIKILLMQPLGDGKIGPHDCRKVADRLTSLLRKIPNDHEWHHTTVEFRDGLMTAYTLDETLYYR